MLLGGGRAETFSSLQQLEADRRAENYTLDHNRLKIINNEQELIFLRHRTRR